VVDARPRALTKNPTLASRQGSSWQRIYTKNEKGSLKKLPFIASRGGKKAA